MSPLALLALWAPGAQAFELVEVNHDWQATEEYCTWSDANADGVGECVPTGTSNDTAQFAYKLGALALGEVKDTARPVNAQGELLATGLAPPFRSDVVTLSHGSFGGSPTLAASYPNTQITSVYLHALGGEGLRTDVDWYHVVPDAGLCVEFCLWRRGLGDRATVQPDWTLSVYEETPDATLAEIDVVTGEGCASWYSTGQPVYLEVADPTPELVLETSYGIAHQYYRLVVANPDAFQGTVWHTDADGDGFGEMQAGGQPVCERPIGDYAPNSSDCDDDDPNTYPGAPEVCDGADNDCDFAPDEDLAFQAWYPDADGDGWGDAPGGEPPIFCADPGPGYSASGIDCDDDPVSGAAAHPMATETCNGLDDDCDGMVDDELPWATYWPDADGDGHGDPDGEPVFACAHPGAGWSTDDDDCADGAANVGPSEVEVCDGEDQDCDGLVDEDFGCVLWYPDADGDGHGDRDGTAVEGCEPPAALGWAADDFDCDDASSTIRPGATEACDGVDQDCDGEADDGATTTWFEDADGDGFGVTASATEACAPPASGWVSARGDCDDASADANPDATETCNEVDDDCDGLVDEGCNPLDIDTGGCATPLGVTPLAAFLPLLLVIRRRRIALLAAAALVAPLPAQAFTLGQWQYDWPQTEEYCSWQRVSGQPFTCDEQGVSNDDQDGAFFLGDLPVGGIIDTDTHTPGAFFPAVFGSSEVALSHGSLDRVSTVGANADVWFHYLHSVLADIDVDVDWYSVTPAEEGQCITVCLEPSTRYTSVPPGGFPTDWKAEVSDGLGNVLGAATGLDVAEGCFDLVAPGGPLYIEVYDGSPPVSADDIGEFMYRLVIDNGDGALEGIYWPDGDEDGYGATQVRPIRQCGGPPKGFVDNNLDCDDEASSINPFAQETCNAVDDDCDEDVDEDLPFVPYWPDLDNDDWGDDSAEPTLYCAVPHALVATQPHDCDDTPETGAKVQPRQAEICNGVDDDCDGLVDEDDKKPPFRLGTPYWPDTDGDGYGDADAEPTWHCADPGTGWADNGDDCDDAASAVNPKGTETCNQVDDDCDGAVDDGFTTTDYYPDADGDGWGDASCPTPFCSDPGDGWSTDDDDCDDGAAGTNPGATEIPYDGVDQDCDGDDACDVDGDGFVAVQCGGDDCDDARPDVNPYAEETWYDGVDQDCLGDDDWDRDHDGHAEETFAGEYPGDLPADDCDDRDDTIVVCSITWVQGGLCATGVGPLAAWPALGLVLLAMRRRRALAGLLLVPGLAAAQEDGFDAHGLQFLPHDADLFDPLVVWRAERQVPMSFGVNGLFEYANNPAVLVSADANGRTVTPLVKDLVAFNLGGHAAFHERLGVALSVPVWLVATGEAIEGSGFGIGDLQLAVPVGLVLPGDDGTGFGLSAVPYLVAPLGAEGKLLGTPGFGGGGWVAATYGTKAFSVTGDVGLSARPSGDYANLNGGLGLGFGLGVAYAITETLAVRAEGLLRPTLVENEFSLTESPGEALLSLRGRYESGLGWTLGGAVPFTRGFGAPRFRVFLGVSWTFGKPLVLDRDGDGFVDAEDGCPDEAEVVNGHLDGDGCPDALATLRVRVLDPEGNPAANTQVTIDGQTSGTTDADGWLVLDGLAPGRALSVGAYPARETASTLWEPVGLDLREGVQEQVLNLGWLPGAVRVIARDARGGPIDAQVLFRGPEPIDPARLGDRGVNLFLLPPGEWTILASADSFGTERRDLVIEPDQTSLVVIELTMLPAVVEITREEVLILEQIQFDFDKADILPASIEILEEVSNNLLTQPQIGRVEIQGHTDSDGSPRYNLDLSQRRMDSVVDYLVGRGVDRSRIVPVGYGEDCPLVPNTSDENKAINRRVQFIILDPPPASGVIPCHDGQPARRAEPTRLKVTEPATP